jgi:hypothetical protein
MHNKKVYSLRRLGLLGSECLGDFRFGLVKRSYALFGIVFIWNKKMTTLLEKLVLSRKGIGYVGLFWFLVQKEMCYF